MTEQMEQDLALFKRAIQSFLEVEVAPFYESWEHNKKIPKSLWVKLGENGFLAPDIPQQYGGLGVDFRFNMLLLEEISKAGYLALAINIMVHADICCHYLHNLGTEQQKQQYLPKMLRGECIAAVCMTEPAAGSDLQGIKSKALPQGEHLQLNGSKIFITNGQNASLYIVAAKTDVNAKGSKGTSLLLVDREAAGFSVGQNLDKMGQHCGDTSEIFFEDILLSNDKILGEVNQGFAGLMQELPRERLVIACCSLAHAEGAFDLALQYANERSAFGSKLAEIQDVRFKLANMYAQLQSNRALIESYKVKLLAKQLDTVDASVAKLTSTEMADRVIDGCLQIFGGYGYMKEYPISRYFVDARVQRIYGGTSEIMQEVISRRFIEG
ncbi:acyl-CoA dehydrogenase family protein [Paraferrimonas sp. SM1919]|uniref:acyl-CoA dehydrogenase family protein n=1 Tax=Paraferrimonas sp. SM1919 TaxID=2662263 RepID=UPI0013D051B8|nr:acyl-CoA dehydrogenase family protein [Paraferrimonas sp. SM1919]